MLNASEKSVAAFALVVYKQLETSMTLEKTKVETVIAREALTIFNMAKFLRGLIKYVRS